MHIFSANGPFHDQDRIRAARFVSHLYYHGSLDTAAPDHNVRGHIQQLSEAPCPITLVQMHSNIVFRRSWQDIRQDGADFCTIRFIKSGLATITQKGRTVTAASGDLLITRSNMPVCVEIHADGQDVHEMVIAKIPSSIIHKYLDIDNFLNIVFPVSSPHHASVVELLRILGTRGALLTREAAENLLLALLQEVGALSASMGEVGAARRTIQQDRLAEICAQIRLHFATPNLSLGMIAEKCGISTRYATHILSSNNSSFYQELQNIRLEVARDLLISSPDAPLPIRKIAYMTGFKTAAHFSHLFKRVFGCSPSEDRAANLP